MLDTGPEAGILESSAKSASALRRARKLVLSFLGAPFSTASPVQAHSSSGLGTEF